MVMLCWFSFCIMLTSFSVPLKAETCKKFPTISREEWESHPKREGEYVNCPYRYSITIPKGFTGRGEAPSHTEHGFGIWLSSHPYGYIWVDGSTMLFSP